MTKRPLTKRELEVTYHPYKTDIATLVVLKEGF